MYYKLTFTIFKTSFRNNLRKTFDFSQKEKKIRKLVHPYWTLFVLQVSVYYLKSYILVRLLVHQRMVRSFTGCYVLSNLLYPLFNSLYLLLNSSSVKVYLSLFIHHHLFIKNFYLLLTGIKIFIY